MYTVFFVIQIILAVSLIAIILIQRSSDDGLSGLSGGGSGGGNAFLSGRASANLLTRATAVLAALFMINSLLLANMGTRISAHRSILDAAPAQTTAPKEKSTQDADKAKPKDATPSVPVAQ